MISPSMAVWFLILSSSRWIVSLACCLSLMFMSISSLSAIFMEYMSPISLIVALSSFAIIDISEGFSASSYWSCSLR